MSFDTKAHFDSEYYGKWGYDPDSKGDVFKPLGRVVKVKQLREDIETPNRNVTMELAFQFKGQWKSIDVPCKAFCRKEDLLLPLAEAGADVAPHTAQYLIDTLRQQKEIIEDSGDILLQYETPGWITLPASMIGATIQNDEEKASEPTSTDDDREDETVQDDVTDQESEAVQKNKEEPEDDEPTREYTPSKVNDTASGLCYRCHTLIGSKVPSRYTGDYKLGPMGSFNTWAGMVIRDVLPYPALQFVLVAGLVAVVNGLIAPYTTGENPIVHICNGSGTGKSTAGELAVSTVGAPFSSGRIYYRKNGNAIEQRSLYSSWGATANAVIARCMGNRGAVLVFNELGKFQGRDMSGIVYNLSEGTDKERLTPELKAKMSSTYFTSIISIGETSLLGMCKTKTEGLEVRVMEINQPMTESADHADRIKKVCRANNGHAAPMMAEYIIKHGGTDYVLEIYDGYCRSLRSRLPEMPQKERFIEKFPALFLTTAEIAREALGIDFDLEALIDFFIQYEEANGEKRNSSAASYDVILEECRIHADKFYIQGSNEYPTDVPIRECWGRIVKKIKETSNKRIILEEYQVRPAIVEKILADHGFPNKKTCAEAWKKAGVLDCEEDRYQKRLTIVPNGSKEPVYVFRVFADDEEAEKIRDERLKRERKPLRKAPSPSLATLLKTEDDDGESA